MIDTANLDGLIHALIPEMIVASVKNKTKAIAKRTTLNHPNQKKTGFLFLSSLKNSGRFMEYFFGFNGSDSKVKKKSDRSKQECNYQAGYNKEM